jgi:hypothetical protein
MRAKFRVLAILLAASAFTATACQSGQSIVSHELVATGNQHSVAMYPDEQTYLKVSRMEQQGGIEGIAGDMRKNLASGPSMTGPR